MSTELQLKGDSRRRQLDASKQFAEAHGLELADDAQLEDIGVSAFKGANVREGALGRFLQAVKAGSIQPGSYLLVESLDRLSREEILPAQALFLSIVQAGINLVTLADNRIYQAGKADLTDLITSLVIMSRAHEESKIKSQRVGAAWKNKRVEAEAGRPMTKWCPAWLRLSRDRKNYEPISDRVRIVRQIFEDTASGVGMFSITRQLNEAAVRPFAGGKGWHQSYVAKILSNRSVLGEFQPHVRIDGVRKLDGEPIQNYFPAVIDHDLYFRAQNGKAERRVSAKGRKGLGFTNLFSGIAICAYCYSRVVFENKGLGQKGGTYLICESAKRHLECVATRWSYRDFEASFLAFIEELDLESLVNATHDSARRKALEDELAALKGEHSSVELALEQTYKSLAAGGPVEFLSQKLTELNSRSGELIERIHEKQTEQSRFQARETQFYKSREDIRKLVRKLQGPPSAELFNTRAEIASRLRVLLEGPVLVAPLGKQPWLHAKDAENERRFFSVLFRDAGGRSVFPKYGDPLQFELQVISKGNELRFVEGD